MEVVSTMHPIDNRLAMLGITLPVPPMPAGRYKAAVKRNGLLFLSGQFPYANGELLYQGRVGGNLTREDGREAARISALNVLAHIRKATSDWNGFHEILRVDGFVSSAPGFYQQPAVLDGASELFANVLGERAGHARIAVSVNELPLNASIEIVVICGINTKRTSTLGE